MSDSYSMSRVSARCRILIVLLILLHVNPTIASDDVRVETQVDAAVREFNVSGRGVTVAILDRGIDWQHADFRNADGTTRIKWLLDMSGQNLCPGVPAAVEYSESQINNALFGSTGPINSRDAVGHGTATAGAAAGNGLSLVSENFRGMAPEADLIIVKLTSEGAPAHGTIPMETSFQGCITEALVWLDTKITALGQPCVAIINSGVQWGPIDGTSAVSRELDVVFGPDTPGRVIVIPSGDEGTLPNHAEGSFTNTADTVVRFNKSSTSTVYGQLWYSGAFPASITIAMDSGATNGPVFPNQSISNAGIYIINYLPGTEFYPWNSNGGDRAVWYRIMGHLGGGEIRIRGQGIGTGAFDAYSDVWGPNLTSIVSFQDHLSDDGRLTDYASTLSAIVVGNSVLRTSWIDIDGFPREIISEGATGELWLKSSCGPTRDGRPHGIDIVAPGQNSFVSLAADSYWSTFRFNLNQDGAGFYGRFGGTSGSAPIITGIVALMLQRNATLTASQVRAHLRNTAIQDVKTGSTPNACWGYGRVDALHAIGAVLPGCVGDVDLSGTTNVTDLLKLLTQWGECSSVCASDVNLDGTVNVTDLLALLGAWGACP